MINEESLKNLIEPLIPGCVITNIHDLGNFYVVYFQDREYIASKKFQYFLVGQGPYIVGKDSGKVFETGSSRPLEEYIHAMQACGDPGAVLTANIEITGWEKDANKFYAARLIKLNSGMSSRLSKMVIDQVLNNKHSIFSANSVKEAVLVVGQLKQIGFTSRQLWSNQC